MYVYISQLETCKNYIGTNAIAKVFRTVCLVKQVDKIVDQLMQYIYNYDLTSLRELWGHLDTRMFCRLESHFAPAIRKLENAVLKMYVVNAAVNSKQDRIQEFFTKMAPELQGHSEWKEWFGMHFLSPFHTYVYCNRIRF